MPSLNISYLIRPHAPIFLDNHGHNWESWLAQIRSDAIICDVWQYIDPTVPDDQIAVLYPPGPVPLQQGIFTDADGQTINSNNNNNSSSSSNYRMASEWALARSLAYDRVREWRLYDDRMYALRVIKAFILATAPINWAMYQALIGGGPLADVRRLLVSLSDGVRTIRHNQAQRFQRQQQQRAGGGGGSSSAGVGVGTGTGAGAGVGVGAVGAAAGGSGGAGAGVGIGTGGGGSGGSETGATTTNSYEAFPYAFPVAGYWN